MEKNIAVSQRETYNPTQFTEFLWWLSTAEKEILVDSVVDRNRYRIIGMTVLATWAFATFAWTYFFSTIVGSLLLAIGLGLVLLSWLQYLVCLWVLSYLLLTGH